MPRKIGIPAKMRAIHHALREADIPHAFGGALALAWCTERARGTIDIDLNVFTGTDQVREVLDVLPRRDSWDEDDIRSLTPTVSSACGGTRRRSTCS